MAAAVVLLQAHENELIAPLGQRREFVARRCARHIGRQWQRAAESCQHLRVDRIGFGEAAAGTGERTSARRVDAGKADPGFAQGAGQRTVVDAGGFKHDKGISASPARRQPGNGLRRVGDALGNARAFVKNVEHGFGDVDSNITG